MLSFTGPRWAADDALLAASTFLSADKPSDSSPESTATGLEVLPPSPPPLVFRCDRWGLQLVERIITGRSHTFDAVLFPLPFPAFPLACSVASLRFGW
jgi:hypothetical protein